jgi:hypothetical protein
MYKFKDVVSNNLDNEVEELEIQSFEDLSDLIHNSLSEVGAKQNLVSYYLEEIRGMKIGEELIISFCERDILVITRVG